MIDYKDNIIKSKFTIYDLHNEYDTRLYIPINELEIILTKELVGISLDGLPLRTRSKFVKILICEALGYPVPSTFAKTQPRFPSQNMDVYVQKSMNVQIWNEEIDSNRRYVFVKVNEDDVITNVKIITGDQLAQYDGTGTLTRKFQATMPSLPNSKLFSKLDTDSVQAWSCKYNVNLSKVKPNTHPIYGGLLRIETIYQKLLPIVGTRIEYINSLQERNRGAELHALICKHLGFSTYEDDGSYPDILNQLIEIKLQTSPTIDLGLHSPDEMSKILTVNSTTFYSQDIRYVIFEGVTREKFIYLKNLYMVNGIDFSTYFPLFKGKVQNTKLQMHLPNNFFES